MQADAWNPGQYTLFQRERKQPGLDLVALVRPKAGMRAIDLGCGTGGLTRELHQHTRAAATLGIDSSEAMLAQSAAYAGSGLSFQRADIATYSPGEPLDLVFSNAALQWVPGHDELLARFSGWLREGGQLAIQLPAMEDEVLHTAVAEVASEELFREALGGFIQHLEVREPSWHARTLFTLGFREQNVSLRVYGHVLPTRDSAVEWMKGTLLTAYQRRLSAEMYEQFVERYRAVLLPRLGASDPYFLPYKRILIWGMKRKSKSL